MDPYIVLSRSKSPESLTYIVSFRLITAYFVMPETENRTLEEIEAHFSDKTRSITETTVRRIDAVTITGPKGIAWKCLQNYVSIKKIATWDKSGDQIELNIQRQNKGNMLRFNYVIDGSCFYYMNWKGGWYSAADRTKEIYSFTPQASLLC